MKKTITLWALVSLICGRLDDDTKQRKIVHPFILPHLLVKRIKRIYKSIIPEKQRIAFHESFYKMKSLFYKGNTYECCCCGHSSRRFFSQKNVVTRENVKCPYCFSVERTRVLSKYIRNEIFDSDKKYKVLHFAPVKGLKDFLRNSPSVSEYIDADLNENVATYKVDITQIPYDDNSFDLLICSHILYCVPEDRKGMQEISRVLKPGGIALIVDTIEGYTTIDLTHLSWDELERLYGDGATCRVYGKDIVDILGQYHLEASIIDYVKQLPPEFIKRQRLENAFDADIIRCTKIY